MPAVPGKGRHRRPDADFRLGLLDPELANYPWIYIVEPGNLRMKDTEGNQLPYIDKIVMTAAENLEVLNLRARTYFAHLWPALSSAAVMQASAVSTVMEPCSLSSRIQSNPR